MGSFLQACCITNQSIQEYEEVYVIPIVENIESIEISENIYVSGLKESIYNTDMFTPLGFIFKGVYADYGRYDINWNNKENRLMFIFYLNYLKDHALKVEQGENSCHDIPFDINTLILDGKNYQELWDKIHEAIWEGRLYLTNKPYKKVNQKVHYHISIKHHSDILVGMQQNSILNEKENSWTTPSYLEFQKLSIKEQAKLFVEKSFDVFEEAFSFSSHTFKYFLSGTTVEYVWNSCDFKEIQKGAKNVTTEDLENLYTSLCTFKYLVSAMSLCQLIFRPVYYGSQDYGNHLGNNYTYLMSKVHEYNIQQRLQNPDEDDSETITKEELDLQMKKEAEILINHWG